MGRQNDDRLARLRKLCDCPCVPVEYGFPRHTVEVGLQGQVRPPGGLGDGGVKGDVLRQARHRSLDRGPRDLAALVEIEGRILLAQDLLDPSLIVQAAEHDLRVVRERRHQIGFVGVQRHGRKAQLHDLGQGVLPDRGLGVVEPKAPDGVTTFRGVERPLADRPHQQEGLARARAAPEHDVRRRRAEKPVGLDLLRREESWHYSAASSGVTLRDRPTFPECSVWILSP